MGKIVYEKRTWVIDNEGHTVTTDQFEVGKSESIQEAVKRGNLTMPKSKGAKEIK